MKFIHIGCWLLNIANKSGAQDGISQIRFNRITVACRRKMYVEIKKDST